MLERFSEWRGEHRKNFQKSSDLAAAGEDLFNSLGGRIRNKWENSCDFGNKLGVNKEEAQLLKSLLEKGLEEELLKGNSPLARYAVTRIHCIKRCVDSVTLQKVNGDNIATERALRSFLLSNWDGPIVKYLEPNKQARIEIGEEIFKNFVTNKRS